MVATNPSAPLTDLALITDFESDHYGGKGVINPFNMCIVKCTWHSPAPIQISRNSVDGQAPTTYASTQKCRVKFPKYADYCSGVWIRNVMSSCVIRGYRPAATNLAPDCEKPANHDMFTVVRYCHNPGHYMYPEITLQLTEADLDPVIPQNMDVYAETLPTGRKEIYSKMVGDMVAFTNPLYDQPLPVLTDGTIGTRLQRDTYEIPEMTTNTPVPFCFSRSLGQSFPTSSMGWSNPTIIVQTAALPDFMVANDYEFDGTKWVSLGARDLVSSDFVTPPHNESFDIYGQFSTITPAERKYLKSTSIVRLYQVHVNNDISISPSRIPTIDLLFSDPVLSITILVANETIRGEKGIYTVGRPIPVNHDTLPDGVIMYVNPTSKDPIQNMGISYGPMSRIDEKMPSDYFSQMVPFFQPAMAIPTADGFYFWSYALDMFDPNATGSTNYTLLDSPGLNITPRPEWLAAANGNLDSFLQSPTQTETYRLYTLALVHRQVVFEQGLPVYPYN